MGSFSCFFFFLVYSSYFPKLEVCRLLAILKKKKRKETLLGALGEQLFSSYCSLPRATFSSGLTQAADPVSKSLPPETTYTRPSVQVHFFFKVSISMFWNTGLSDRDMVAFGAIPRQVSWQRVSYTMMPQQRNFNLSWPLSLLVWRPCLYLVLPSTSPIQTTPAS